MKKGLHDEMNDELRSEYDLSQLLLRGVRGKYAKRFRAEGAVMPEADAHIESRPEDVSASIAPGSPVRIKTDPRRRGVVMDKTRNRAQRRYWQVMFPEGPDFVLESQLELVSDGLEDPIELLEQGKFGRAQDLREILTYTRLNGRLANLIYSMETTNTDFYAYQFKPVVNFLESPGNGIVIADEVGLGKTIEAGLIWTELRSREDARRLLVLCPAMLQEKWREELLNRFGIDAEITDAAGARQRFSEFHSGSRRDYALIGSMQGLRPRKKWDTDPSITGAASELARYLLEHEYDEPLLDLLIVDEAHYLRNPETSTSDIGRLLRNVSIHVVLLSATPIHLRSRDLYQLLNLVDEDTFNQPDVFDFILEANEPLVAARDMVLGGQESAAQVVDALVSARSHPLLDSNRQLAALLDAPPTDKELNKEEYRSELANKLEKINLLGRVVTRTRKREVEEWRVLREAVPEEIELTPTEREFYESVTGLVREYCEQRDAHEGFLLVTPQRQMASSMPAALREWMTRAPIDAHAMYEDLGADDSPELEHLGPLVREITRRVHELGNFGELKESDSKYARFSRMLKRYLAEFPQEKVVLFAYFRATLHYLNERLTDEGIRSVTLTGGTGLDKHEIISRFRDAKGPSVLLSSEVASEGVDLQFARVIVNYDLPWNPMKVEQRIGRIDRLGQQAPKITIWNLFYSDTIDSRIYNRLYMRLGLFERTLGGLEAVLGEKIRGLTMELLRGALSPQQEEERIEQAAMALANYRLHEEELEQEAGNLIAHGDYILNQVRAMRELNRWITGEDLWVYVRDFFTREYKGSEFKQITAGDLVFDIKLSADARFDLDQFLRSEKLLHQTALSAGNPKGVRCEFRNRPRGHARATVEYITQFHPLIRFASRRLRGRESHHYHPTVSVAVPREVLPSIPCGVYGFTIHRWSVRGLRNVERLNFEVKSLNGTGTFLNDDDAEQIVTTVARSGSDWLEARSVVRLSHATGVVSDCIDRAESRFHDYVNEARFENEDRADVRKRSLERHWNRQRSQQEEIIARHREHKRVRLLPAVEGKLAKLNEKMEQRLREIESQRTLRSHPQEICMGLIRVE